VAGVCHRGKATAICVKKGESRPRDVLELERALGWGESMLFKTVVKGVGNKSQTGTTRGARNRMTSQAKVGDGAKDQRKKIGTLMA